MIFKKPHNPQKDRVFLAPPVNNSTFKYQSLCLQFRFVKEYLIYPAGSSSFIHCDQKGKAAELEECLTNVQSMGKWGMSWGQFSWERLLEDRSCPKPSERLYTDHHSFNFTAIFNKHLLFSWYYRLHGSGSTLALSLILTQMTD